MTTCRLVAFRNMTPTTVAGSLIATARVAPHFHRAQDIWIAEDGEATLVVDGAIVDPNEILDTSIDDGERYWLRKASRVPANVPLKCVFLAARLSFI